jgi:hypothetical protein
MSDKEIIEMKAQLKTLQDAKDAADAKRLKTNAESAAWHRQKRLKNQFFASFFEKNAKESDKQNLQVYVETGI